jgi:hypothetical protein
VGPAQIGRFCWTMGRRVTIASSVRICAPSFGADRARGVVDLYLASSVSSRTKIFDIDATGP